MYRPKEIRSAGELMRSDGPFAETNEMIGGYAILELRGKHLRGTGPGRQPLAARRPPGPAPARLGTARMVSGVFYWEPEAYPGWQGYEMGAVTSNGEFTAAMTPL